MVEIASGCAFTLHCTSWLDCDTVGGEVSEWDGEWAQKQVVLSSVVQLKWKEH